MDADCREIFKRYVKILTGSIPNNEAEYKTKNITLNDIQYLISHLEDFIAAFPNDLSKSCIICKLCELTVGFGLVHQVSSDDRDYSPEDFPYTAVNAVECFQCLKPLLKEVQSMEHGFKRHFLINVLLLCATHNKTYHWSSSNSITSSEEFLSDLLQCTQHSSLMSLLCDDNFHPTIFKGILKKMRPSLMKDTWMLNPSSCYIFSWLLCHVKHPHLVEYLPDVFPPPFMFVSYHAVPQKVLGIQCFSHLLDNVPPTLMKLDGKEDVIFHSLFSLIYLKELPVIEVLFPCLLKLPMMKTQKAKLVYWEERDKIFNHLLFTAEYENNREMKKIYLSHIKDFVECSPPFNHLKRLIEVVKTVLIENPFSDLTCKIITLQILKAVIKSCWPRMEIHCFDILISVLDLQQQNDVQNNDEVNELSEECLTLLRFSCEDKFMSLTSSYVEDPNLPGVELLKRIIAKED
ncbi:TELO2-interacting protein 2-like [Argiope bruennichi]|uniref:TELO2-interacting protein 2-like n=1 Tax=Argiope bruennichi TaxID=94029 RepID=UPI002493D90D|nr:TELO2-interacting protein 2-like [Argiope bruennichi]